MTDKETSKEDMMKVAEQFAEQIVPVYFEKIQKATFGKKEMKKQDALFKPLLAMFKEGFKLGFSHALLATEEYLKEEGEKEE